MAEQAPPVVLALSIAVQAGVPVLLWGSPGTGKSSAVRQLASALDWPLEVVIASLREPADFAGLPVLREEGVLLFAPSWAHRLAGVEHGILFLDEITTCAPATQAALLRVVLERVVGDVALSDGVSVVAAANPPDQAAGGWDLTPPLANRFCHLEWAVDTGLWAAGLRAGSWQEHVNLATSPLPEHWQERLPEASDQVATFLEARPTLLLQPPREDGQPLAWPSPRSWTAMARLLAAAGGQPPSVLSLLCAGCVGRGPAAEFLAWRSEHDLGDINELLRDPKTFKWPSRADQREALLQAVVRRAMNPAVEREPDGRLWRWKQAAEVIYAASENGMTTAAATAALALEQLCPSEITEAEMREWRKHFGPLLGSDAKR